ncbi:MAG: hypothetical protein QOJ87_2366 [Verrucomicrobiota bacterium]|jgi:hypothetical protein
MQDGWVTAGYNALNQPMYIWSGGVGWTYFAYDPLGRCVKRWGSPALQGPVQVLDTLDEGAQGDA